METTSPRTRQERAKQKEGFIRTHGGVYAGAEGGYGGVGRLPRLYIYKGDAMLLTVKDLAQQLQIKPTTLYAWAAQQKIPSLKIHGVIRFESEAIKSWLHSFGVNRATQRLVIGNRSGTGGSVEALIATAKRAVYTSSRGNQTNSEPT